MSLQEDIIAQLGVKPNTQEEIRLVHWFLKDYLQNILSSTLSWIFDRTLAGRLGPTQPWRKCGQRLLAECQQLPSACSYGVQARSRCPKGLSLSSSQTSAWSWTSEDRSMPWSVLSKRRQEQMSQILTRAISRHGVGWLLSTLRVAGAFHSGQYWDGPCSRKHWFLYQVWAEPSPP